jgi:O-antigen ligase
MTRFVAGWAALAVMVTSATQLRSAAVPVGPGEVLLATWLLFVGLLLLGGRRVVLGSVFRGLLVYWLIAVLLLGLGMLMALSQHKSDGSNWMHHGIALALQALFTCILAIRLPDQGGEDYYEIAARTALFACFLSGTVLLVAALLAPSMGPIQPWYGHRFRGWAENPNQMALMVLGMPFLGWHLLRRTQRLGAKVIYGLAILGCVWVGLATWSDGLRVAWLGALAVIGFVLWCRALRRSAGPLMYLTHLIVPALVLVLGIGLGGQLLARFEAIGQGVYSEGDQGAIRMATWRNGLEAIGHSPLVGFGPGSYSGLFAPFQGFEAHSTYIDWGMSTGALGVALQVALLAWAAWRAWRARAFALLAGFGALFIFSIFAYTLRQPIYWLLLVLTLRLAERRADLAPRQVARSRARSGNFPLRPAWQTPPQANTR